MRSHPVMSESLRSHWWQHARLPCPSLSPGVCSNSCPLNWWFHPIISSSVVPFSSSLQKSISSLVLSLFYDPILTSVHDYWKNHNFDYMDLCQQSDISASEYTSRFIIAFNFMAAVTFSDFEAQGNSLSVFPFFSPIYIPWSDGTKCHDLSFLKHSLSISYDHEMFCCCYDFKQTVIC